MSFRGIIASAVVIVFTITSIPTPTWAQSIAHPMAELPVPGSPVDLSPSYQPVLLKGMTLDADNPFQFNFVVDAGESGLKDEALGSETRKLVKYFLASLAVPENEMWVNLSPYEDDRIIPDSFGQTEMGRDLLAQDYLLKQMTASLMHPEGAAGQEFWTRIYERAQTELGLIDIPVDAFNKVWIVPQEAKVFQHGNSVFVAEAHLDVMTEADYVALQEDLNVDGYGLDSHVQGDASAQAVLAKELVREIILPELEHEINHGKNFANLRQIYHSQILAVWYKQTLRDSILGEQYVNQKKIDGINLTGTTEINGIYDRYVEAFQKGVYDFVREDYDPQSGEVVTKRFVSGGAVSVPGVQTTRWDGAMLLEGFIQPYIADFAMLEEQDSWGQHQEAFREKVSGKIPGTGNWSLTKQNQGNNQNSGFNLPGWFYLLLIVIILGGGYMLTQNSGNEGVVPIERSDILNQPLQPIVTNDLQYAIDFYRIKNDSLIYAKFTSRGGQVNRSDVILTPFEYLRLQDMDPLYAVGEVGRIGSRLKPVAFRDFGQHHTIHVLYQINNKLMIGLQASNGEFNHAAGLTLWPGSIGQFEDISDNDFFNWKASKDKAMLNLKDVGGINLNPAAQTMDIQASDAGMLLNWDQTQFEDINLRRLVPVLNVIRPADVAQLRMLLGMGQVPEGSEPAVSFNKEISAVRPVDDV